MICNCNHNRNRYYKGTVIMIILNRNQYFLACSTINNMSARHVNTYELMEV